MPAFLDAAQVKRVLRYEDLVPAMERALAAFSSGETVQPVRQVLTIEERSRFLGVMPAVVGNVMGCKLVAFYPANEGTQHPTHQATIALMDRATGDLIATMDGTVITEMRTAAVSAAVTKYCMREGARVLALVGSGVQAGSHLEALRTMHAFADVRVWSRNGAHAQKYAKTYGATAYADPESAVRDADVIVVATGASEPVLHGAWLKDGVHVNAVGACRPDWRELDDAVMRNTVIVDSREAAMTESGDVILSGASIAAEAGELFNGRSTVARTDITVFKSLGLAVEDVAAAELVAHRIATTTFQ